MATSTERIPTFIAQWQSHSVEETIQIAEKVFLLLNLGSPSILVLEGPLGAGKTHFVKGLGKAFSITPEEITSPTYALAHEYIAANNKTLVHMDWYRLQNETEVAQLGFDYYLADSQLIVIEWGLKFPALLPLPYYRVQIETDTRDEHTRFFRLFLDS